MRILVTRPEAQAEATAQGLRALGHEPVVAPLLRIEPTDESAPTGAFDALIVTSANAAPFAALSGSRSRPVFAVGARTADKLRREGFLDVRAGPGDAGDLALLICSVLGRGARLVHVAGEDRKDEPAKTLGRKGFIVTTWVAYRAIALARLPEVARDALMRGALDAALHYSRRSAAILVQRVDDAGLRPALLALNHVCLSTDIAEALPPEARRIVAARPDEPALFDALTQLSSRMSAPEQR